MTYWSLARAVRALALLTMIAALTAPVSSAVSQADADKLKTTLTPLGAERAGSADGQIPAWTGEITPGFTFRSTPFDNEKPIVTISAANMAQYADKLSDGLKAMMQRYPDYKIEVYPTHRTQVAPQWVYDYTYQNALNGKLNAEDVPSGVFGGIHTPFRKTARRWCGITFFAGGRRRMPGTSGATRQLLTDGTSWSRMSPLITNSRTTFAAKSRNSMVIILNFASPQRDLQSAPASKSLYGKPSIRQDVSMDLARRTASNAPTAKTLVAIRPPKARRGP